MTYYCIIIIVVSAILINIECLSLNQLHTYEVVYPEHLHEGKRRDDLSTTKRENRREHLDEPFFYIKGDEDTFKIKLAKNRYFLHPHLRVFVHGQGAFLREHHEGVEHCYYNGYLTNNPGSRVVMSTCKGLSGVIKTSDKEEFHLEPYPDPSNNTDHRGHKHILYRSKDVRKDAHHQKRTGDAIIPSEKDLYDELGIFNTSKHHRRRRSTQNITTQVKYAETVLAGDYHMYTRLSNNVSQVIERLLHLAVHTDDVYSQNYRLHIVISRILIQTVENDGYTVTNSLSDTLTSFQSYNWNELMKSRGWRHDIAAMVSSKNFDGAPVGLAYQDVMCKKTASSVTEDWDKTTDGGGTSNVMIHEMGHNFGFVHDDDNECTCPKSHCMMQVARTTKDYSFTDCDDKNFNERLTGGNYHCLLDYPSPIYRHACGDGVVGEDEECDCGTVSECERAGLDKCCNATNCKLKAGAQCAIGECCNNCTFKGESTLCRSAGNDCDLAEYCTGNAAKCPHDSQKQDGTICDNNKSFCYQGKCAKTASSQCKHNYGQNVDVGAEECWNNNVEGTEMANCGPWGKSGDSHSFTKCKFEDSYCGKLQCDKTHYKEGTPNLRTGFYYGICVASGRTIGTIKDFDVLHDETYPEDGQWCEPWKSSALGGKMCLNQTCKTPTQHGLRQSCSARCNGGECDKNGECYCPAGKACPYCQEYGHGGSHGSGATCTVNNECVDIWQPHPDGKSCSTRRLDGDCTNIDKKSFMDFYCKKTCGVCGPGITQCSSNDTNCACVNSVCSCNTGFKLNCTGTGCPNVTACVNIDECSTGTHDCDVSSRALCTDTSPGFTCSCRMGYFGDGKKCKEDNFVPYTNTKHRIETDEYNTYNSSSCRRHVLRRGFPVFGHFQQIVQVCKNGIVKFGASSSVSPVPLKNQTTSNILAVSAFWADITLANADSKVYYDFYDADADSENNSSSQIQAYIRQNAVGQGNFTSKLSLVVTLHNMRPKKWNQFQDDVEEASVQMWITTDYANSFVVFLYRSGKMTWLSRRKVKTAVPVKAANGTNSTNPQTRIDNLPVRGQMTLDTDDLEGNTGRKGEYVHQISDMMDSALKRTSDWYNSYHDIRYADSNITCPCHLFQALMDPNFEWTKSLAASDEVLNNSTFQQNFTRLSTLLRKQRNESAQIEAQVTSVMSFMGGRKELCFYHNNAGEVNVERKKGDALTKQRLGLKCCYRVETGKPRTYIANVGETVPLSHYTITDWTDDDAAAFAQVKQAFAADAVAFNDACVDADSCDRFLEKRPVPNCHAYKPPSSGHVFGDPHFQTFDELSYSLNGVGNYHLVRTDNQSYNAGVQMRTCPAHTNAPPSNGTSVCGFVIFQDGQPSIEMHKNVSSKAFQLLINGTEFNHTMYEFGSVGNNETSATNIVYEKLDGSTDFKMKVILPSSLTLMVTVGDRMLHGVVFAAVDMNAQTSGLLGNNNGDSNDDLQPPSVNGTALSINSTDEQIYNGFGLPWAVSANDSKFSKPPQTYTDWSSPKFFNTTLELYNNNQTALDEAVEICGNVTTCLYDYYITKDAVIAVAGKTANDDYLADKNSMSSKPPQINGPKSINLTLNTEATFTIEAASTLNSNLTYSVSVDNLVVDAFSQTPNTFNVTVGNNTDVSMTIRVTDEHNNTAEMRVVVQLCACTNGGKCNSDINYAAANRTNYLEFFTCSCPFGRDTSMDCSSASSHPCVDMPCYEDSTCSFNASVSANNTVCGSCPAGFVGDGRSCAEIDNCVNNGTKIACGTGERCQDNGNSTTCECLLNHVRVNNNTCEDLDECAVNGTVLCGSNSVCSNMPGSYNCTCASGYESATKDGKNCTDINECLGATHGCTQHCNNTIGSYNCTCYTGFSNTPPRGICVSSACDGNPCEANAKCTPTEGGNYTCACKGGFNGTNGTNCVDINECTLNTHNCDTAATCTNSVGGYSCKCNVGYLGIGTLGNCIDIDECYGNNTCHMNADCTNTPGGYSCACKVGFTGNATSNCSDINECLGSHSCDASATCNNTIGSYSCSCGDGFESNGTHCNDLNECIAPHNLTMACNSNNTVCTNTPGSFNCTCPAGQSCACFPGYNSTNDDLKCVDIDECSNVILHGCHAQATCTNYPGNHTCTCKEQYSGNGTHCACATGYDWNSNNTVCVDLNECVDESLNNCDPKANCTNSVGSFSCACVMPGTTGNGTFCSCLPGYNSTFNSTTNATSCSDVDECADPSNNNCHSNATCQNNIGSFSCSCKFGYTGDGKNCSDVNECDIPGRHDCHDNASCANIPGSFDCKCNHGYNGTGQNCSDINECLNATLHKCHPDSTCKNLNGSHECSCPPGSEYNGTHCNCAVGYLGNGTNCTDINECSNSTLNNCHSNATCLNAPGNFSCLCNQGFSGNGTMCEDVDECLANPCHADANCTNLFGSFDCQCQHGYYGNGTNCTDVDECGNATLHGCHHYATCTNSKGSHSCACKRASTFNGTDCLCNAGYHWNGTDCADINECLNNTHNCHSNATCSNTDGNFTCQCNTGFSGSGYHCIDVNECINREHNCHQDANCTNDIGSFSCHCHYGYQGNGTHCSDVDECTNATLHQCHHYAYCTNSIGSHNCTCKHGSVFNGTDCVCTSAYQWNGTHCEDINECVVNTHNCHANASCSNTNGNFTCNCTLGFRGNGYHCDDINECNDPMNITMHQCHANANCSNTFGSYDCVCHHGYNGTGKHCQDIDECESYSLHQCKGASACKNLNGTHECSCLIGSEYNGTDCQCAPGYAGNGTHCTDINECLTAQAQQCHVNASCINTEGSFNCSCGTGLTGNGTHCADLDECTAGGHNCHSNATCTNHFRSFSCKCKKGFLGNGSRCSDINECSGLNSCHRNANCSNMLGSYRCDCKVGFRGNGTHCNCHPGYEYNPSGSACIDVDECSRNTHNCHVYATCSNTRGSFNCTCGSKYRGNGTHCEYILPDCRQHQYDSLLKAMQDEDAEDHVVSHLINSDTRLHKIAVSKILHTAQDGCGVIEVKNGTWVPLQDVNLNRSLVLSHFTGIRYRRTNVRCSAQCHGRVGIRYSNVRAENDDFSKVSTFNTTTCDVHLLLQPGPNLCPACVVVVNSSLDTSMQEDSPRKCFNISDIVAVDKNMTASNIGSYNISQALVNQYNRLLDDLDGVPGIRIKDVYSTIGGWSSTANRLLQSQRLLNKQLVNTSRFLCFRPDKNKFGNTTMQYTCSVRRSGERYASSDAYDFSVDVMSVNDPPILKALRLTLTDLPNIYNSSSNTGKKVADLLSGEVADSPEGITNLGLAITKLNTNTTQINGKFQWRANSTATWKEISGNWTLNAQNLSTMFLLKSDAHVRFVLDDTQKYWSLLDSMRSASFNFLVWDMSDGKDNGVANMTAATSISLKRGIIVQHRIGCFGPGTKGGADDACGICGGDNSTCSGCDGVPNSGAKYDRCQVCFGGTTGRNRTVRDCFGGCGTARLDSCDICQRNETFDDNKFKDCFGICKNTGGTATLNKCGLCTGGQTGKSTDYGKDLCGVCSGDNSTCKDCAGVPNGNKTIDLCKQCLEPSDKFRDACSALGAPSKTCISAAADTFNIPVANNGSSEFTVTCKLGNTSANATRQTPTLIRVKVPGVFPGSYNVSCHLSSEPYALYATKKVFIVDYQSVEQLSLNVTEGSIGTGPAIQNLEVTGQNFPNSGYVGCVMTVNGKKTVLEGMFVNDTKVVCKGFPKQKKSMLVTIGLKFCQGDILSTTATANFTWYADLPSITKAQFTNCKTVVIEFSGAVEPVQSGECNLTTLFPYKRNGTNATLDGAICKWRRKALKISILQATLHANDELDFSYEAIKVARESFTKRAIPFTTVNFTAPPNRAIPTVVLVPRDDKVIGKCSKFLVSYYTPVRAGMTAVWSVYGSGNDSVFNSQLVNKRKVRGLNIAKVNSPVKFSLALTNCFGDATTKSVNITKEDNEVPLINMKKSNYETTVRKKVTIRAPAKYGCAGVPAKQLVYTWAFSPQFDTSTVTGKEGPKIMIQPKTLKANTTYTATLTVGLMDDSSISSSSSATITVGSLPLKGRVTGVQAVKDTGRGKFRAILRDPDESTDSTIYTWSMTDASGIGVLDKNYSVPVFADSERIEIDFSLLSVTPSTYTVTCVMTKGSRTLTSSIDVTVKTTEPPAIEVTGPTEKLNWPSRIYIPATILGVSSGTYQWSSEDYPVSELTGTSGNYRAGKQRIANLVIDPKLVTTQFLAQKYTFKLETTQTNNVSAYSSVEFEINGAPSTGTLTLEPTTGEATSTEFTVSVNEDGCVDDDGVEYVFGYIRKSDGMEFEFGRQTESFKTTTVGAGIIDFYVKCIDSLGASTTTTTATANVTKPALTAAALQAAATTVTDLAKSGDPEALASSALNLVTSLKVDEGETLSASEQEADLELKDTVANVMLESAKPAEGDTEAGKQFIEVAAAVMSNDSPAETKKKMAKANGVMLGVDLSSSFAGGSRRRRRRSVSGTSGVDPSSVVANGDVAFVKSQINLNYAMNSPPSYSSTANNQKKSLLQLLDTYSIGLCKTMVVGQTAVDVVATSVTMRTVQLDMKADTTTNHSLGCQSSDTDCSSTIQSPPFSMTISGVDQQVCLASTTMLEDMHSTSDPTDTVLSNVVRIRMWNSTAEIKPTDVNVNVTIYSKSNTTKSYKCVIWDDANKVWTNTSITTQNPSGELDPTTLKYHVTCNLTQLGDVMLVEGPEIIIITEAPTTTKPPTTTAKPTSTTKAPSTTEEITTKKPDTSTKKATTKKTDSTTKKDTTTKKTTTEEETTTTTMLTRKIVQITTEGPTTNAPTTEGTTKKVVEVTTKSIALTVHPDDVDQFVKFVLHAGNCSDAFDDQSRTFNTQSARDQVADQLDIHVASMEGVSLNCTAAGVNTIPSLKEFVEMSWTQTPRELQGDDTVKSVVQLLKSLLSNNTFNVTLNNNTMLSRWTVSVEPPTTSPPPKKPENYDHEVSFTLHKGNCSDVFNESDPSSKASATAEVVVQLATVMNIPTSSMKGFNLACGSVIAAWTQTSDGLTGNVTVVSALAALEAKVAGGTLVVKVGNFTVTPDATSFKKLAIPPPTVAPPSSAATTVPPVATIASAVEEGFPAGGVVGICLAIFFVVLIVVVILKWKVIREQWRLWRGKKSNKVDPEDNKLELTEQNGRSKSSKSVKSTKSVKSENNNALEAEEEASEARNDTPDEVVVESRPSRKQIREFTGESNTESNTINVADE